MDGKERSAMGVALDGRRAAGPSAASGAERRPPQART